MASREHERREATPLQSLTLPTRQGHLHALFQRYVRYIVFADVDLLRSENAVVLKLFQPVSQPAGDAGDGEDRREQVPWDAERLVDDAREEIDIGVDTLRPVDWLRGAFQFQGHLIELRPAVLHKNVLR